MSTLLLIAGTGLQATSMIQQGRIAAAQGEFAEQMAVRNQQALERQAKAEVEAAKVEESRIARKEKIFKAQERMAIGKSGVGFLAGATMSVLTDIAFQFSFERNLALRRGLIRSQELREAGQIELVKGKWAKTIGYQTQTAAGLGAAGSILGTAGMYMGGDGSEITTLPGQKGLYRKTTW